VPEYKVTRYEGGRAFPNGIFGRKADAEKHAEYVRDFHGSNKGDVKVTKVATLGDSQEAPEEADDAGQERGPAASA